MENNMEVPTQRLAKHAVLALRWGSAVGHAITLVVLGIFFAMSLYFSWGQWSRWIVYIVAALTLISAVWSIGFRPFYLHKHFRYGFSDEFLQIKSGAFYENHELIPMTKIQAVSTNQGPILRKFGLYSLTIETMGSSHEIPALPKEVAVDVRTQIATFAKIREVDE